MKVSWSRIRRIGRKHLAGILAGVAVVVLVQFGLLDAQEHWSLAQLFELRGSREPMPQIVIVTIDESTFTEMNEQWPFARARHAELLMQLAAGKPRLIGIDLIFDAPSSRGPKDDDAFGKAIAFAGNVVLGAAYTKDIQPYTRRETFNFPIPVPGLGAAAVATVNMDGDADGDVRRVPLMVTPEQLAPMPAFDTTLHRLLAKSGFPVAPLPTSPSILINFRGGRTTYPWVSYHRVVRGEIPSEHWKDKIVLIGPTSPILHDQFPTAFAPRGDSGDRRRLPRFFSPAVAREVVRHKDEGILDTSRRLVTVLFSDIRGFTSLSEQLQPEQVAEMLREYLTEMTEIVFRHGGAVDKYIGDCVMALYNVPLEDPEHAVKAVRTALEFQ